MKIRGEEGGESRETDNQRLTATEGIEGKEEGGGGGFKRGKKIMEKEGMRLRW